MVMNTFSTPLHCDYFPICSGCDFQGQELVPPVFSSLQEFFAELVPYLEIPLIYQEPQGWRFRAKLAVRGDANFPLIGLFQRGTHNVVSIPNCPLHHRAILKSYQQVRQTMIDFQITPYDECKGVVRYLQFLVEEKSQMVQLSIVVNISESTNKLHAWIRHLYSLGGFHSTWLNFNTEKTNRIFGDNWLLCAGEMYLRKKLGKIICSIHPACFVQSHLSLFEHALSIICQEALPSKRVCECYSGMGVIGLNLASFSKEVQCIEINPFAKQCFDRTCSFLSQEIKNKMFFHPTSMEKSLGLLKTSEVIVVDPPRKGLEAFVLDAIDQSQAEQLIYLSCSTSSFIRDCGRLLKSGWRVEKVFGYLFFPGSNHVETLCILKRS
ncbi:putative RNA methyltransferase SP_1029 [Candidatus Rhabdochlamydia oedothoracis]|uniref:RNA methyltransferase SP_1029 n=2 Tax=Candidatus Rhabdochlamydia TaxID=292833 RepID=A0ABX8UYK0_9BACT|nr:hypothetical protein [Candidatus Rhabdochlamydia oedothoracis]KAG6559902.1 23S rRNA (uracil-C(5))-methyltransferase RlmCD [Candidatus Rhabdochlamydia sp. W815]QYF48043.1 putative RNA methyltransferase SP_1029 [Candidatus Rhabdochlamydia oedothoracis]